MTDVAPTLDLDRLVSARARSMDASGIRRVFELGATLKDPINLSIGQPDFPVPDALKDAAIEAIRSDRNGYTVTTGDAALLERVREHLRADVGWSFEDGRHMAMITSGTSGALCLAAWAMLDDGDEMIIPDPWFVMYPQLGPLTGGRMVAADTYPDFRLTAERIERAITPRTKAVLVNSPGNPSGVVLSTAELQDIVDLCRARGIVLISDEIYDEFVFSDAAEDGRCPSPARLWDETLLVRGFGKTYGCTGWRLGYVAGPTALIQQMAKLQQYTYVCAPSIAQHGVMAAFDTDLGALVSQFERRRDLVVETLSPVTNVTVPGGAFYAFFEIPERLGMTATEFIERAVERRVLVIPGNVFSARDTHVRLSFAIDDAKLAEGLAILRELLAGG